MKSVLLENYSRVKLLGRQFESIVLSATLSFKTIFTLVD